MSNKNNMEALVRRAQSGDSAAFNQLFSSCYNDIYYFALKTVKKEELAYDITQEACIDIFKNISSLQDPGMFVAWSKRITYNRCAQYFRKNQEILVDENEDGTDMFDTIEDGDRDFIPDEALDKEDFRKTIMDMINGLSEEQRTAVMLYYFDELSISEIAQIQGVSEGTVKSRLNYARKAIKSAVEDYEDKNGVKLHSFGLLPLLLWLRGGDMAGLSIPTAGAALQSTAFSATSAIGSSAAATAGTAATSTVAAATTAAASKGIAVKIIAAIAAVAIAIGGGAAAYKVMSEKTKEKEVTTTTEVETTDKAAPNHSKPTVEQAPDDYASEYMEVYGGSFDYRDRISKYLSNIASYFVTTDGEVYDTYNPTEPLYTAPSADDVYCFYNGITYTDENGNLISEFFGTDYPLGGIDGEVVAVLSTGWFYNIYDVITKDSNGNFYYASYGEANPTPVYGPLPIRVYNGETGEEIGNIVDIKPYYNAIYDTDETYIITENMIYVADSYGRNEGETEVIFNVKPVTDTVGGIIESNVTEDEHSPFYFKNPDDTTFYRHTLGTLTYGESEYYLPEGYTASQIEKVITAYHTWIIVFDDGSVYTYGGMYETSYYKIEYLSDLYKEGHIVDIYMEGQSIISEDFNIILHMDDGGLYVYRGQYK